MLFKFLRKLLGIEENRFEPCILAGKYKPRIYNPDVYKVDDDFGEGFWEGLSSIDNDPAIPGNPGYSDPCN